MTNACFLIPTLHELDIKNLQYTHSLFNFILRSGWTLLKINSTLRVWKVGLLYSTLLVG